LVTAFGEPFTAIATNGASLNYDNQEGPALTFTKPFQSSTNSVSGVTGVTLLLRASIGAGSPSSADLLSLALVGQISQNIKMKLEQGTVWCQYHVNSVVMASVNMTLTPNVTGWRAMGCVLEMGVALTAFSDLSQEYSFTSDGLASYGGINAEEAMITIGCLDLEITSAFVLPQPLNSRQLKHAYKVLTQTGEFQLAADQCVPADEAIPLQGARVTQASLCLKPR
jgi:hypothetical protein